MLDEATAAERKVALIRHDNRKYENISNYQRNIAVNTQVNVNGFAEAAESLSRAVLGATATKSTNASTARIVDP